MDTGVDPLTITPHDPLEILCFLSLKFWACRVEEDDLLPQDIGPIKLKLHVLPKHFEQLVSTGQTARRKVHMAGVSAPDQQGK